MANIAKYLENILSARYGEEVRGSIHDAINKMNVELENSDPVQVEKKSILFRPILSSSDDMNNLTNPGIYKIVSGSIPRNAPTNNTRSALVVVVKEPNSIPFEWQFVVLPTEKICYRVNRGENYGGWSDWIYPIDELSKLSVTKGILENSDLNDLGTDAYEKTGIYVLSSTNTYKNSPIPDGQMGWLINMGLSSSMPNFCGQIAIGISNTKVVYYRRKTNAGNFLDWEKWIDNENPPVKNLGYLPNNTDLNDISETSIYLILTSRSYTNNPPGKGAGWLLTIPSTEYIGQLFIGFTSGQYYYRNKGVSGWNPWRSVSGSLTTAVAYGDSTTYGYITSDKKATNAWPLMLNYASGIDTTNRGVSGQGLISNWNTIINGFSDLDNFDLCILAWGYNDGSFWNSLPLGTGEESLGSSVLSYYNQLFTKLQREHPKVQLIYVTGFGMYRNNGDFSKEGFNIRYEGGGTPFTNGDLYDGIEKVCKKFNIPCINQHGNTFVNSITAPTLLQDGLHPTEEGYRQYSRNLVPKILSLFEGRIPNHYN